MTEYKYDVGDKVLVKDGNRWLDGVVVLGIARDSPYGPYLVEIADRTERWICSETELMPLEEELSMPSFESTAYTETVYQWKVKFPAPYVEVCKAINSAEKAYRVRNNLKETDLIYDNALVFVPDDEAVVIEFRVKSRD